MYPWLSTNGVVVVVREELHDLERRRVSVVVVEEVEYVSVWTGVSCLF
jgi:hypothetical protein